MLRIGVVKTTTLGGELVRELLGGITERIANLGGITELLHLVCDFPQTGPELVPNLLAKAGEHTSYGSSIRRLDRAEVGA